MPGTKQGTVRLVGVQQKQAVLVLFRFQPRYTCSVRAGVKPHSLQQFSIWNNLFILGVGDSCHAVPQVAVGRD